MPFGFHPTYLIILLIVVLIIFGPGKLPELGSAIGRGIREFRRESDKIMDDVRSSASEKEPSTTASTESGKAEAERKS
jgi:sec-independent protein translocase protein TatA